MISFLYIQSCSTNKSEIMHGKICPFCFADNPSWRKNYCPDCLTWDKKNLTDDATADIVVSY